MKKIIVALGSILMMFCLTACGSAVATVNGVDISEKDYTAYIDNLLLIYELNGYDLTNDQKAELKDTVIEEMVNQECVTQAAKELDCYPTEDEIETYFDEKLAETFGDAETGKSYIKEAGLDLDVYRYSYEISLCQEKIGEAEVPKNSMTKDEATATFEAAPDDYYTRTVSHILITPDTGDREVETDDDGNKIYTDEEWAAAEAKAEDLIAQLDDGGDFATLAKENSDDTNTASSGGSLGEAFTKEGSSYVEEFTDAAFAMTKAGQYTETPVRSTYGYHIIKVDEAMTKADKTAIVKKILSDNLESERSDAATAYVEDFQNNADIEYFALSDSAQEKIDAEKEAAKEESGTTDTTDTTDTTTKEDSGSAE